MSRSRAERTGRDPVSLNRDIRDPAFMPAVRALCEALGSRSNGGLVLKDIPQDAPGYVLEFRDGLGRERLALVDVVLDVCAAAAS